MTRMDRIIARLFAELWREIEYWLCTRLHDSMKLEDGRYVHYWRIRGYGIGFWVFPSDDARREFESRW